MFKKLKIKKLISLFLVFLLSVNSLFTYAGDNDGSSFITKAEFDSLKNNFQSQLDEYNTGIDAKIDEAIAAYLAGVSKIKIFHVNIGNSILEWPLKIYYASDFDFNTHYGNPSTGVIGTCQWRPNYYTSNGYNRSTAMGVFTMDDTSTTMPWSTFLNYKTTTTVGGTKYAIITDKLENYKATYMFTNWLTAGNRSDEGAGNANVYAWVLSDVLSSYVKSADKDYSASNPKDFELNADGSSFGTTDTKLSWTWIVTFNTADIGYSLVQNTAKTKWYKRQSEVGSSGWWFWTVPNGTHNEGATWTRTFDSTRLNKIYNKASIKVPTSKDNIVNLSNYHNVGVSLGAKNVELSGTNGAAHATYWYMRGLQCPPFTILDVDHCSKTDMFDTAFINSERLMYEVEDTNDHVKFNQIMTDGIYLYTPDSDGSIEITLNSTFTGANPQVFFRYASINDEDASSSSNLLFDVKTGTTTTAKGVRYVELTSGTDTTIKLQIDGKKKLFMKLIKSDTNTVTLNEPIMIFTTNG